MWRWIKRPHSASSATPPETDKAGMIAALKEHTLPALRTAGFKGSFPHFHRDRDGFVALINFQFFSAGGSFCVNIGYADPARTNVAYRPDSPASALRVSHTRVQRRLGAPKGGDNWFSFGKTNYGEFRGDPVPADQIAKDCAALFATEAETWWASHSPNK